MGEDHPEQQTQSGRRKKTQRDAFEQTVNQNNEKSEDGSQDQTEPQISKES